MIIVPELETVVILVPRTGTTALKNALLARYSKAMQLYRHMEADGVPHGYDRWRKVGVVREPVERLWSLYKFTKAMPARHYSKEYVARCRASARLGFDDWIIQNEHVFTNQYDSAGSLKTYPGYAVLHSMPENRKSQHVYLRPDLGTQIWRYSELGHLAQFLNLRLRRENASEQDAPPPALSMVAMNHVQRFLHWDIEAAAGRAGGVV